MDLADFKIDRESPVPLYYQIEQYLLMKIQNGGIAADECLPPETELMEMFDVSRITIRQAIGNLVNRNILVRHKGKGTFVRAPKLPDTSLQVLESFHEEMSKKGYEPETRVMDLRVIDAEPDINRVLGLGDTDKLIYLCRYRSVNGEPYLYFETYLSAGMFAGLLEEDLEKNSLYDLLERKFGHRVDRVTRHIEVMNASEEDAQILGISQNDAIFLVTFIGYSHETTPVEYSVVRYRGDVVAFTVEVRR